MIAIRPSRGSHGASLKVAVRRPPPTAGIAMAMGPSSRSHEAVTVEDSPPGAGDRATPSPSRTAIASLGRLVASALEATRHGDELPVLELVNPEAADHLSGCRLLI